MTWPTTPAADECGHVECIDCGEMIADESMFCDDCERTREATNGVDDFDGIFEGLDDDDRDAEEYDT